MMKLFTFLYTLSGLLAFGCSMECIVQDSSVTVRDAITNDEVRECVLTAKDENQYTYLLKVYIESPNLTEMKSGVFAGFRIYNLEINAQNLVKIESGILDPEAGPQQALHYITINSKELRELNEAQWTDAINLWSFKIIGTKLTSISFAFMSKSNMRELYLHNATYLRNIDRNEAYIMGTYEFQSTGIAELPLYMFEKNTITSQRVTFRNNTNIKVLRRNVFHGGFCALYVDFFDSPIEIIEPDFIDFKDCVTQIQLGGNRIGKIERAVFEPLFKRWKETSRDYFIKWDVDGARTSDPVECGCSINWLVSDPAMLKYVKNAVCTTGEPLEGLSPLSSNVCFECPASSGLFADPTDCTAFYQCSNFQANRMACPEGLVFNDALKTCDWPFNTAPPCGTA